MRLLRIPILSALFVIIAVLSGGSLYAHTSGQSYIFLKIFESKVTGRFEITLNDLNKAPGLESPRGAYCRG